MVPERWVCLGMNDGRNLNRLQELINWISGNGAFLGGGEQHSLFIKTCNLWVVDR